MFIDADNNYNTGLGGADYIKEMAYNASRHSWTSKISEFSNFGVEKPLRVINNADSLGNKVNQYSTLSLKSADIVLPASFRVLFYTYSQLRDHQMLDLVGWVRIPPPKLFLSSSPSSVDIPAGEKKTVQLQLNSTFPFEYQLNLVYLVIC